MTAPEARPSDRIGRRRRLLVLVPLVLMVITLASTWSILARWVSDPLGQPAAIGVTEVTVEDDRFTPSVIAVPLGTTITFTWAQDSSAHNVVFEDGLASQVMERGTFQRQVTTPGDLVYRCTLHPFMDGMVQVMP